MRHAGNLHEHGTWPEHPDDNTAPSGDDSEAKPEAPAEPGVEPKRIPLIWSFLVSLAMWGVIIGIYLMLS